MTEAYVGTEVELVESASLPAVPVGDRVRVLAHELKTPLSSIIGYSRLLLSEAAGPLLADQRSFLDTILENAERLVERVEEFEGVAVSHSPVRIDLFEVLDRCVRSVTILAAEKGIAIEFRVPDVGGGAAAASMEVIGEFAPLEQVFLNLLTNAIKYTPAHVSDVESTLISVVTSMDEHWVTVAITDRGRGIADSELPLIFEPGYRSIEVRDQAETGQGLGLAIANDIVRAQGGTLAVESVLGRGSTFSVRLPRFSPHREDSADAASAILNLSQHLKKQE